MTKKHINYRIQKRNKRRKKKRLFISLAILLMFAIIGTYSLSVWFQAKRIADDSYQDDGRDSGSELRADEIDPTADNISILFIGVDQSEKREKLNQSNELSDTLILATLNKKDNSVKMVSIPRDSYVYIDDLGYKTKINHAHANGGVKSTIETVEGLFEVPVDYYVKINFDAFIDVVDELGGITVDVPYELYEQNSKDEKNAIHLLPGEQNLNGEEALALARTRKQDNDIERGKRQQEIIKAMVDQAVSFNTIFNLSDLMKAVGDNMTTNLTTKEMRGLISYGTKGKLDIESMSLKGQDLWTSAYYYELDEIDLAEKQDILKEHLNLDDFEN